MSFCCDQTLVKAVAAMEVKGQRLVGWVKEPSFHHGQKHVGHWLWGMAPDEVVKEGLQGPRA